MNKNEPTVTDTEVRLVQEDWTKAFCLQPSSKASRQDEARFIQAAERGEELRKLRAQCVSFGFRALPLDVYLADACAAAGVALGGLWRVAAARARDAWIALARMAQVPEDATQVMLRAQFALHSDGPRFRGEDSEDSSLAGLLLPDGASLEESARLLDGWEAQYTPERRERLRSLLDQVTS